MTRCSVIPAVSWPAEFEIILEDSSLRRRKYRRSMHEHLHVTFSSKYRGMRIWKSGPEKYRSMKITQWELSTSWWFVEDYLGGGNPRRNDSGQLERRVIFSVFCHAVAIDDTFMADCNRGGGGWFRSFSVTVSLHSSINTNSVH